MLVKLRQQNSHGKARFGRWTTTIDSRIGYKPFVKRFIMWICELWSTGCQQLLSQKACVHSCGPYNRPCPKPLSQYCCFKHITIESWRAKCGWNWFIRYDAWHAWKNSSSRVDFYLLCSIFYSKNRMMTHHSKNRMMTHHHVIRLLWLPDMFRHVCMTHTWKPWKIPKTMEIPWLLGFFSMVFMSDRHVTILSSSIFVDVLLRNDDIFSTPPFF